MPASQNQPAQAAGVLARVAAALAGPDPEQALGAGLMTLREAGLVPCSGSEAPWLEVDAGGRRLALSSVHSPPPPELHEALGALLGMTLARSAERRELLAVQERLDMLSEASFEAIIVHDGDEVVDVNARALELLRCERADIVGPLLHPWFVAPEDLDRARQRVRDRTEEPSVITAVRKDGSRFLAEVRSKQGARGERPVRVVALRDVTDRERATALLGESEARLRELAEAAFDYIVFTRGGMIVGVTGRVKDVLGYEPAELVGRPVLEFVAPPDAARAREVLAQGLLGAREGVGLSKSGEHVPVSAVTLETTYDGVPVRMSGIRDLRETRRLEAERRKLDEQRQRSQRLESLGVLAGGIAHDFNNLLTGVLGNASLLIDALEAPEDRELCSTIIESAERAADLTAQLLAYAGRRELGQSKPLDVSELWREIGALLGARLTPEVRLELNLAQECVVLGDRPPLTQVFMNLLTNAADASRPGGTIAVTTRRASQPDARWQGALGVPVGPGDWVLIEVRDDGIGMSQETLERIFEPFFTTKARGHGLGLASCLGIVSAHGGALLVESAPALGTTFSILLPAAAALAEARAPSVPPLPHRRTVLVIDDEPTVRSFLRRSLERAGLAVIEASNGLDGLQRLAESSPDVVLLDLGMPHLDGAEVLRRLRADGFEVPVLIASGHVDSATERRLVPGSFQGFLRKPFSPAELVAAVRKARGG